MNKKKKIIYIPLGELMPNPMLPRSARDPDALAALAGSIRRYGVLEPLCVTPRRKTFDSGSPVRYSIIAGERRWRAAKEAGLKAVPCVVFDFKPSELPYISFAENVFREQLSFFDIAESLNDMSFMTGLSPKELANRLSVPPKAVTDKLKLLSLTPQEREKILSYGLTEKHALALLRIGDKKKRALLAARFAEYRCDGDEADKAVTAFLTPQPRPVVQKRGGRLTDMSVFINSIDRAVRIAGEFGARIERSGRDCGDSVEITLKIPKPVQKENAAAE